MNVPANPVADGSQINRELFAVKPVHTLGMSK